jgi:AcrR family transcriptional regulator
VDGAPRASTRDIARAAVRAQLSKVAFELFLQKGFEEVTVTDLAVATGVSRSTFLRYFTTKEEAVLAVLDMQGERIAEAIGSRPAGEDDWTALRRALDAVTENYRQEPAQVLTMTRLIRTTPALCAWHLEKQLGWRPALVAALAARPRQPRPAPIALSVMAAAALDCLNIAVDRWFASGGEDDLDDLLDQAFAALART